MGNSFTKQKSKCFPCFSSVSFLLPGAAAKPFLLCRTAWGREASVSTSDIRGDQWPQADLCHGTFHVRQTSNMKPSQNKSSGRQQRMCSAGHVGGSAAADTSTLLCRTSPAALHDLMELCSLLLLCLHFTLDVQAVSSSGSLICVICFISVTKECNYDHDWPATTCSCHNSFLCASFHFVSTSFLLPTGYSRWLYKTFSQQISLFVSGLLIVTFYFGR